MNARLFTKRKGGPNMKRVYIWMVAVLMGANADAQVANALKNAGMENIRVVNSEEDR